MSKWWKLGRSGGDDEDDGEEYEIIGHEAGAQERLVERGMVDFNELVAPSFVAHERSYIQIGDEYQRTIYMTGYPAQIQMGWLDGLFLFKEAPLDISMFIIPMDKNEFVEKLRMNAARAEARLAKAAEDEVYEDTQLRVQWEYSMQLIEMLENNYTRPFQISLIVRIRAKSLRELDDRTLELRKEIANVEWSEATDRQIDGLMSTLPAGRNHVYNKYGLRNAETNMLRRCMPFTAADLTHESGVMIGTNPFTMGNIIIDRFSKAVNNPGMLVMGGSGSGKSYFAKSEMAQWAMLGLPIIVIDPQNEYDKLCAGLGGQFISMGLASSDKINPFDFSYAVDERARRGDVTAARNMGDPVLDKIRFMVSFIQVMLRSGGASEGAMNRGLSADQRTLLDQTLRELYAGYGYKAGSPATQISAKPSNMPTMSELHNLLRRKAAANQDPLYQQEIRPLIAGLGRYIGRGGLGDLFDHHTTVELTEAFVVFNILNVDEDLWPIVMNLVLEYLRTLLFTDRQRRSGRKYLLYVDECQRLMKFQETAAFLEGVSRTARKFGVAFTALTQDPDVFLLSEDGRSPNKHGRAIVQNCATRLLMRQEPHTLEVVQNVFKLSAFETRALGRAQQGQGIIFVQNESAWVNMARVISPEVHRMITSDHGEVAQLPQLGAGE
jgi:hypothetical protein